MTPEEYYKLLREEQREAQALAREVANTAHERNVRIPSLVKALCEEFACGEASIAERGAYEAGHSRGVSDGRVAERRGW